MDKLESFLSLLKDAQKLALEGWSMPNILQPGAVKELIMASALGHQLDTRKHGEDARTAEGGKVEYLTSIDRIDSSFHMERMTNDNFYRIKRNCDFYFGLFRDHLTLEEIWTVDIKKILKEAERQHKNSKNKLSHVSFQFYWVKKRGNKVYPKEPDYFTSFLNCLPRIARNLKMESNSVLAKTYLENNKVYLAFHFPTYYSNWSPKTIKQEKLLTHLDGKVYIDNIVKAIDNEKAYRCLKVDLNSNTLPPQMISFAKAL